MTEEERSQIRFLREAGYSYGKIAEILGHKRSTISDYCLRHQIIPSKSVKIVTKSPMQYRRCPFCHQLYLTNTRKSKEFCSVKCRTKYWNREKQESKRVEQEAERLMTLQKELDFCREESDELDSEELIYLCRKPITNS